MTSGLSAEPIDVRALEAALADRGHGAVVTFVGRARDRSDDGREVVELEYEVFPEMAESVLAEIAAEAEGRFGVTVAVVHRHGLVRIGEAAVVIVTSAPHREEAYAANRQVIEAIKQRLPIWKRERFADGSEWKRPGA
jgi:molybdopterin synthase catalytic subunit